MKPLYSRQHFAVRHAASKDQTRGNLCGIRFEADGSTVATDGHCLIHAEPTTMDLDDMPESVVGVNPEHPLTETELRPFTLPTEAADRVLKGIPKGKNRRAFELYAGLDLEHANANGSARFSTADGGSTTVEKLDGGEASFPDWPKVLPQERPQYSFGMDPKLLTRVLKACQEFDKGAKVRFDVWTPTELSGSQEDSSGAGSQILKAIRVSLDSPTEGKLTAIVMPCRF